MYPLKSIRISQFQSHFIPAKTDSKNLMIVLHGRGDSLKPFRNFDQELNLSNMNYLLLNAPRKYLQGYTWYGEPPFQKQGVIKIRKQMLELLIELEEQGWKSENIFLLGFSQGSLISADLALHWPKPLAGFIGVSGYFQFFPRWRTKMTFAARKTPWLMTHGIKDDVLDIEETEYGIKKLKQEGLKIHWVKMNKGHVFHEKDYPVIRSWVSRQISS